MSFRGRDLRFVDLSGCEFAGGDFRFSRMQKANLKGCNITDAQFYGADIRMVTLDTGIYIGDTWNLPGRVTKIQMGAEQEEIELAQKYSLSSIPALSEEPILTPEIHFILGFIYETFGTHEEHKSMAKKFYELSDQEHFPPASNNLGWMYEHGYGVKKSIFQAKKLYKKAEKAGNMHGQYNAQRLAAIGGSPIAQYLLASSYRRGISLGQHDMDLAFHWYEQATLGGHKKAARYAGVMLRHGAGTYRDDEKAVYYLSIACTKSHKPADGEALFELGIMHENGTGTPQDFSKAMDCYERAAKNQDHSGAFLRLGNMYEYGLCGEVSYQKALGCYRSAGVQERISGLYNAARMYNYLGTEPEKAVELLQKILLLDPLHTGAQYLLASHYHKGFGIPIDKDEANRYFQMAADGGHKRAQLRIALLGMQKKVEQATTFTNMEDVESGFENSKIRIKKELQYIRSVGGFSLGEDDFYNCVQVRKNLEDSQSSGVRMNWEFICYDPFVADLCFLDPVEKEECTPEHIFRLIDQLRADGASNPALSEDLLSQITIVGRNMQQRGQQTLRERFIRLYRAWTGSNGLAVPDSIENPTEYRKGLVAQILVQNIGRCGDGLSLFFAEQELAFSLQGDDIPLGLRISHVLCMYKEEFLQQYFDVLLATETLEIATETFALIKQRMRLPLGMPGVYTPMLYQSMARQSDIFDAKVMLKAFLLGTELQFGSKTLKVHPYTVTHICTYIHKVIDDRSNTVLSISHITDFLGQDSILAEARDSGLIDLEPNLYVDPLKASGLSPYTLKTIERILFLHGYILNHNAYY